jgi:hypothetical protein
MEANEARAEFRPTPGPWKAIEWNIHAATTVVADRPGENPPLIPICECSGHGRAADECLDDARLIAAAPRMLDLLERLGKILEPNPTLDTQAQIDGANSAAVAIARKRIGEFFDELEEGYARLRV